MAVRRVRPLVRTCALCAALGVLVAACGSADRTTGDQGGTVGSDGRAPTPQQRGGVEVLGCGPYCRTVRVEEANAATPQQDVHPPYAAEWVSSRHWAPRADGIAPIKVTCRAGLPCEGALVVTIYHPTQVITAPQLVVGRSDLRVEPRSTRTIGVQLTPAGLGKVRGVMDACRQYRATQAGFPPDPSVGLTVDARASRDKLAPDHRRFLTWVSFAELICA